MGAELTGRRDGLDRRLLAVAGGVDGRRSGVGRRDGEDGERVWDKQLVMFLQ
jgi:hypothetical protein